MYYNNNMDLLRTMVANRQMNGLTSKVEAMSVSEKLEHPPVPKTGLVGAVEQYKAPGSRAMRKYIIEETPGKKVIKKHLEAIISAECESSSEEE
jgi:hypothetical protein